MALGLQIASDLHLEFYRQDDEKRIYDLVQKHPDARYLALLGDISAPANEKAKDTLRKFLAHVSGLFETVFYLCGNHEFYVSKYDFLDEYSEYTVDKLKLMIQGLCEEFPNVVFLDDSSVVVEESIRIVGSVLWSFVPPEKYEFVGIQVVTRLIKS